MKRILCLLFCVCLFSSCAATTTQVVTPEADVYTFKFEKWQSFFYQDDEKTGLLMYQVKDIQGQQIPKEFKVLDKVYRIKIAYPPINTDAK